MRTWAMLLLLVSTGCLHPRNEEQGPRCPESDKAACTSGPLVCQRDQKRNCDLCTCKHEVF